MKDKKMSARSREDNYFEIIFKLFDLKMMIINILINVQFHINFKIPCQIHIIFENEICDYNYELGKNSR